MSRDRLRLVALCIVILLAPACSPSAGRAMPTVRSSPATAASNPGTAAQPAAVAATTPHGANSAWVENFDNSSASPSVRALLQYRTGGNGWGNSELQTYTDREENVTLDGQGHLVITAIRQQLTGTDGIARDWTSARLDSLGLWSFTTGTLSARIKIPTDRGLWPAFWLEGANLPTVGWPTAGEIDVMESVGAQHFNGVYQSIHGPTAGNRPYVHSQPVASPAGSTSGDDYHVYAVTRSPGLMTFSIDGKVTWTVGAANLKNNEKWVFDTPMFFTINLAVGGDWPGSPTSQTPTRSSLTFDWIRYDPLGGTP